jgi:hypothetical protein
MRQRARIQRLRRGPWPGGARTIARLPRVNNDDGQARRGQGAGPQAFQATRGFQHHQDGVEDLELVCAA